MYEKNKVVFIPAMCGTTGKKFYIREDIGADGKWVRTYGVTNIPKNENINRGSKSEVSVDLNNHRIGPQYKCPHCGNTEIFFCSGCSGIVACCHSGGKQWRCYKTGETGILEGYEDSTVSGITDDAQ